MSVFYLFGKPCVSAKKLLSECRRLGIDSTDWEGKANSFTQQVGVDPSYGYLLVDTEVIAAYEASQSSNPPSNPSDSNISSTGLTLVYKEEVTENNELVIKTKYRKFPKVLLSWAKKITPAATDQKGFSVAFLTDERYALANSVVTKRFNYVTEYGEGTFHYDSDTIKTSNDPYTWQDLFKECWKVPSNTPLTIAPLSDSDFPSYVPQDVDFRYVSRRDALATLCLWCNMTIVPADDGKFTLVKLSDPDEKLKELTEANHKKRYKRDRFHIYGDQTNPRPGEYKFHFRKLELTVAAQYTIKTVPSDNANKSDKRSQGIRLPLYDTDDSSTPFDLDDAVDEFKAAYVDRYKQFPPQEITYFDFLSLTVSGYLEEVVWYSLGGPACTRIRSARNFDWDLLEPRWLEFSQASSSTKILIGKIVKDIPVNSKVEDCVEIQKWNPGTGWYDRDDDYPNRIGGINFTGQSIRASTEIPTILWGQIRTHNTFVSNSDPPEAITKLYFEGIQWQPSSLPGHKSLLSDVTYEGQGVFHRNGNNSYEVDGGLCPRT